VHGESNILLIHYTFVRKVLFALLEIRIHTLIRAALYPLHIIVSSVFQVPDTAMVQPRTQALKMVVVCLFLVICAWVRGWLW
jgi:hypothetical protein